MKKKLIGLLIISCILLSGCGSLNKKSASKEFAKLVEDTDSYYIEGEMEIINNEDVYTYDIKASYKKKNYYKIELTNISNDHQQIILRNEDGVYVVTPALNKSFKFQSDWPYNNSQVYLLNSLLEDIENDDDKEFEKTDNGYVFTTDVDYPNNENLVNQKIYLDKKLNVKQVKVFNKDKVAQIVMKFKKIDLNSKFKSNYFDLDNIISIEDKTETKQDETIDNETKTEETMTIEDIVYPMYLPKNTYLTDEETIDTDNGQRLIMTFGGDSSFMLIEETVKENVEHIIEPTFGDVEMLGSSVAVVNSNSVNWYNNNMEYYLVSSTMSTSELLEVAKSISVLPVSK